MKGGLTSTESSADEAYQGMYRTAYLAVAHRWLSRDDHDHDGVKLREIRRHVVANPSIQWVWFDHSCVENDPNIRARTSFTCPLLYLAASVLILVDVGFMGRFWPMYESWLSVQHPTAEGVRPASGSEVRCTLVTILSAGTNAVGVLRQRLSDLSRPEDAAKYLSQADIEVTSRSDKEIHCDELMNLDADVKRYLTALKWFELKPATNTYWPCTLRVATFSRRCSQQARLCPSSPSAAVCALGSRT